MLGRLEFGDLSGPARCPSLTQLSRWDVLRSLFDRLIAHVGLAYVHDEARRPLSATLGRAPEAVVPHPFLRSLLLSEPAVASLLPCSPLQFALSPPDDRPFRVTRFGVVLLPTALVGLPNALGAVARWGLEAGILLAAPAQSRSRLSRRAAAAMLHGAALIRALQPDEQRMVLALVPDPLRSVILAETPAVTPEAVRWLCGLVETTADLSDDPISGEDLRLAPQVEELTRPLENLIVAGGDSRLVVDPRTGLNRYGTTPRPRPEAVQFSSSTASSISESAFALCDTVRRSILSHLLTTGDDPSRVGMEVGDHIRNEIAGFFGLHIHEADTVLAPSGTDTELLTTLIALAADRRPVVNILVAPEETGRGVILAGEGRYFDDMAATGIPVRKGEAAWPDRAVRVVAVPIRDEAGAKRSDQDIERDIEDLVARGVTAGERAIVHVVLGSKTGLSAPSPDSVERLTARFGSDVDIVVDACQLRVSPDVLGDCVRRGWLVQISGSKFLTGPPFSGALLMPLSMRGRAASIAALLARAPAVSHPDHWGRFWRDRLPDGPWPTPSFGILFRWIAALVEGSLLSAVPSPVSHHAFDRFRTALAARLTRSEWLLPIEVAEDGTPAGDEPSDLAARSIVCFAPTVSGGAGGRRRLSLAECQRLFELLNLDVVQKLPDLTEADAALARQAAHIGQPVELRPGVPEVPTILRLVVGARFFTIVGFAGPGAEEAALTSEVTDAIRAVDKLELLLRHWNRLGDAAGNAPRQEPQDQDAR
jgi:hypothetical protein